MNEKVWTQKQKARERGLRDWQSAGRVKGHFAKSLLFVLPLVVACAAGAYFLSGNFKSATPLEFAGNTITVRAGGDFQAALERAKAGDVIQLQAGATFKGAFLLPNKTGDAPVTIRTTATDAQLPPTGERIEPKKYAAVLPKLSVATSEPVITSAAGAHNYRFVGVEFEGNAQGVGNVVKLGTTEEKRVEDLPRDIEFDRVYIHGNRQTGARRGIAANGRHLKITNSYISDIKRRDDESQAIAMWATDGGIEITNNYLEAAGENILFGGAESYLKLVASDCVVRNNWLNKPLEWRGEGWNVKNLFEIKSARRIKIDGNLMTNNWGSAQDGTGVVFKSSDSGAYAAADDIEFTNNVVRGTGNGVSFLGTDALGGHRLTIRNNVFDDIDGAKWNSAGFFMKGKGWTDLTIENNTIINSGSIANLDGAPTRGFVFRNNVVFENEYGFKGDGAASGKQTIDKFFPGGDVSFNAIIGGDAARYRSKNFYPSSLNQLGFTNPNAGDFSLLPNSQLRGKGFQGKNIGADINQNRLRERVVADSEE